MGLRTRSAAKAETVLATAAGVAHGIYVVLFAGRIVTGTMMRWLAAACAAIALVGVATSFVGGLLLRYGGRTPARRVGVWCIAFSTALAAFLLLFA